MNEEEFKECSVVAYPHEIRFLHIKGGHISYYVDRHVSDYVNKLQQELQQKEDIINKAIEELYIWGEILNPEFQKRMLEILDNKGEVTNGK